MSIALDITGTSNLLGSSGWTVGTGSCSVSGYPTFNANQTTSTENNRYVGTDPWGNSDIVWQSVPSGDGNADGGWNTDAFTISNTKLYRFSVWVRRTSSTGGGTFYFGCQSSTGAVNSLVDNTSQSNPYWTYIATSSLTQNQWYLYTGHIFPVGYPISNPHPDSGVYTISGGRVSNNSGNTPNDCAWQSGTTTGTHRTYHYYCADSTTRLEFYDPRVDLCDGTEPSIQRLLQAPLKTNSPGIIFSDGSKQYTSVIGSDGALINVQSFTSSGTWTKPSGCKKVLVKLVGGGGGAAGYCESGGAGGYAEGTFDVTGVSTVTVTVGGGGASVAYYAASGNGGTSSFGSYISASGGYGSNQNYSHSGGLGGIGSGGSVNVRGGGGNGHTNSVGSWSGGRGGQSYFGGSAGFIRNHGNISASYLGKAGNGSPGAGGPGAQTDGSTAGGQIGGYGENGIIIVYAYT
jgi:hypothetical protein